MNKGVLIGVIILVVVLLLGGGFFILNKSKSNAPENPIEEDDVEENLKPADPSIMVDLTPRADGRAVTLKISKIPSDINAVEYELSYSTEVGIKGAGGKVDLKGKTELERELLFGTCSKSACTYDKNVTEGTLTLKFYSNTETTFFSKTYPSLTGSN